MFPYNHQQPIVPPIQSHVKVEFDSGRSLQVLYAKNVMYTEEYRYNNAGVSHNEKKIFTIGYIKGVRKLIYDPEYAKAPDYLFTIKTSKDEERNVLIKNSCYGKAMMVLELKKAGIEFCGKHSDNERATLIINVINSHNLLYEDRIFFHNGFEENHFLYLTDAESISDLSGPFYQKRLMLGESEMDVEQVLETVAEYASLFSKRIWICVITLMSMSLMCSLFSKRGLKFSRLVWINGRGANVVGRLLQIYNTGRSETISLKDNTAAIKKKIFEYRDSGIIFNGNNKEKIEFLEDVFCKGHFPDVNINGSNFRLEPQAIGVIISDFIDEVLQADSFCKLLIDEDINKDEIDIFVLGRFVQIYSKFVEKKLEQDEIDKIIKQQRQLAGEIFDDTKRTDDLAMILTTHRILKELFEAWGVEWASILNEAPEEFFASFIANNEEGGNYAEETCINLIRRSIAEVLLWCRNIKAYTKKQCEVEVLEDEFCALYDLENVYFYGPQFERLILSKKLINITQNRVLDVLFKYGYLANRNAVRLSVKIKGNKALRSNWIAVKRDFIEYDFELPLIEEQNKRRQRQKILLGNDSLGRGVYLPIGAFAVNNNHIGITGDSGMGKSYASLAIVNALANLGIPTVIIDTEDSFSKNTLEPSFVSAMGERLDYVTVYSSKLPLNIFARQKLEVDGEMIDEKNIDIAGRSSGLISRACALSEKQHNELYKAIAKLLNDEETKDISLRAICKILDNDTSEAASVASGRIRLIADNEIFREDGTEFNWGTYFDQGKSCIFSLSGFTNPNLKRMIAEVVLQDLWGYLKSSGNGERPVAILIDELNILRPKKGSTLAEILTLGRKFGIACIWNTQLLKGRFNEEEIAVLNQSATRLYFKTEDLAEQSEIKQKLNKYGGKAYEEFENLVKTTCLVKGTFASESGNVYSDRLLKIKIPLM